MGFEKLVQQFSILFIKKSLYWWLSYLNVDKTWLKSWNTDFLADSKIGNISGFCKLVTNSIVGKMVGGRSEKQKVSNKGECW